MSSLDPRVEKELREAHEKKVSLGKTLSAERRKASLEAFQTRFGPERLRSLDDPELLNAAQAMLGNVEQLANSE